jgi:cytochrome c-type biogenesis protein CcmF
VALASATTFAFRGEVTLRPGTATVIDGQTIRFERLADVRTPASFARQALVLVNGQGPYRPAVSQFGTNTDPVGTPAIDSRIWHDVYLTINRLPASTEGPVSLGVIVQPLVSWLWVGGGILILGCLLAAVPGRRRRPTDPVSAPVPALAGLDGDGHRHGDGNRSGRRAGVGNDVEESAGERVPAGSP